MQNWILALMEQFGYSGVFLLIAMENVFPPIPSEVILPFGGFMTTYTSLTVPGVVAAATAGSVVGAVLLYAVGRLVDVGRLEMFVDRWGYVLRLKIEDIQRADMWFKKYGYWAVFLGRMVPLVRSLISIPAGMSHLNFWVFLFLTTVGTIFWNVLLVSAGAALGKSWETILHYMGVYSNLTYVVLGLGAAFLLFWWWHRNRSK